MKILILTNFGLGLWNFRKELLEAFVNDGNEVIVSFPNDKFVQKVMDLGCRYVETKVDRRGTNPIRDLKLTFSYIKLIKRIKPDIVLTYTVKPNVYGGLACRITNIPYLPNITGLGTAIENEGLVQKIVLYLYKIGLKNAKCIFFQNDSNKQFFIDNKIVKANYKLLPGSGVNIEEHCFEEYPEDDKIIKFLFVGRIMKDKGIDELLKATIEVNKCFENVEFHIVGFCEENYNDRLHQLSNQGLIYYHGQQEDVHKFIKMSHVIILPSYHEGMSNVLLEAASTGRPILASSIPGCKETFIDGKSGYGFEVKNVADMVKTIKKFIELPYKDKSNMGMVGRKLMEKDFDRKLIIKEYSKRIEIRRKR